MFYHYRRHHHCTHGFLFILSLVGAFFLGKHCEAHGYTLMSQWCGWRGWRGWRGYSDSDNDSDNNINTDIPDDSTPSYPQ